MSNFGNRPGDIVDNFGQSQDDDDKRNRVCCINETTRFDITLVYEDFSVIETAYMLNYAAYLKCQKKCPPSSFTTSDADSTAPKIGSGEVNIRATWKESKQCELCVPGALRKSLKLENCRHIGTLGVNGSNPVGVPPPTLDEILMLQLFVDLMASDPPDEMAIRGLMAGWVEKYCTKAKCTDELKLICRTVEPPPK